MTEPAKQKAFELFLKNLDKEIATIRREMSQLAAEIKDADDVLQKARDKHRALTKHGDELKESLNHSVFEFHRIWQLGWEKWKPDLIEQGEIKGQTDAWKKLPAREHFQLSDAVWNKLLEHCKEPVMSVGKLSDVIGKLENGALAIKGMPIDTPGLPNYSGTSNSWAKNYGKQSQNAPYSKYWDVARKYVITAAQLPKDSDAFYLACKAGYTVAFGTSQRIVMNGSDASRTWSTSGGWMHAMAGYGYNEQLDAVGIDNSHGDGFAWASRKVLQAVVDRSRYFDAFVILGMTPRQGNADWNSVGRN